MIAPQNYQKIKFECIYQFLDCEINRDIFIQKYDVNCPIIIIIIIKKIQLLEHILQIFQLHQKEIKG